MAGDAVAVASAYSTAQGTFKPLPQQPSAQTAKAAAAAARRGAKPMGAAFSQATGAQPGSS